MLAGVDGSAAVAKAPPSNHGCTACSRPSRRLCALSQLGSEVLYEVCETCYLCEEIRRLASCLPEETSTYDTLSEGLGTLYALARAAVEERQQNVGGTSYKAKPGAKAKAKAKPKSNARPWRCMERGVVRRAGHPRCTRPTRSRADWSRRCAGLSALAARRVSSSAGAGLRSQRRPAFQ